jgi:predicted nucleic acid-binding protein
MSFVLDSSVTLTWCFDDEQTIVADQLLDRVVELGAFAPLLWPLEILNVLEMAQRRDRITAVQKQQVSRFLRRLPITIDMQTAESAWSVTAELAARFRLTIYDATYLELAQRLGLPLATLDKELKDAAAQLGVTSLVV